MVSVSLIIPTYNEAKNLPLLLEEIFSLVDRSKIDLECIVVDDNSPDGTGKVAQELSSKYPLKVIHRAKKMGLGSAVSEGFRMSTRPYVGVIDADLSHDPHVLNELILSLQDYDITIGSRFAQGSTVENWKWWRKALSNVGVFLAKKITKVQDPLSGYFFLHRKVIDGIVLKTKGYKILLEILVKGNFSKVKEIPFVFRIRKFSTSKLNYAEYLLFFGQLLKYSTRKFLAYLSAHKDKTYFFSLLLLSGLLLFYKVEARSFWMDETAVLEYLHKTPNPFQFMSDYFSHPDNHPPLYYFLVIAAYKILPLGELGIRLVSVLSGLGIVATVYYFSLLLFKDKNIARLAMFLTSVSSYFILISQMARYHSLTALLTLISLYYFCKIVLEGYDKKEFVKFLVLAILLCYTDLPHFIYLVVLVNIYYLYRLIIKKKIASFGMWTLGQSVLLVSFLPIVYLFYLRIFGQNDMGFGNASILGRSAVDWLADFSMHFYAYFFGENILPWNYIPFALGMAGLLALLVILIRNIYYRSFEKEFYLLFYLFFASIILNTIFLNYADPRYNFIVYPKYVFVAFPLWVVLLSRILWQVKNKVIKPAIIGVTTLTFIYGLYNFYYTKNYINGSYFNDFKTYEFVEVNSRAGDYLIINGDANLGVYYFYKNSYFKNLIPVSIFDLPNLSVKNGDRFWFFSTGSDGDAVYGSASAVNKVPPGFTVVEHVESVPIDPRLIALKQKITGRESYQYKYGVYLLTR